jgi:AraC family transcriptional regulator
VTGNPASRSTATDYAARWRRVLEHIDRHLGENLGVADLCGVAAFSRFHFHRQFAGLFGVGVAEYVRLTRLKRASYELAYRKRSTVEIALDAGYETPEAFARAFKKTVGQTPTAFRRAPQWETWHAVYRPIEELRSAHMKPTHCPDDVRIVDFPATPVATLEHRGDPRRLGDSIRRFIAWRRENGLPPSRSATFNVVYDDELAVAPTDFRFDLCAATERPIAPNDYGIVAAMLPPGRCAVLRHIGSDANLRDSVLYLYGEWLPQSGAEVRDFPLFFERVKFYPDVPEHEAVTDIFLPLK